MRKIKFKGWNGKRMTREYSLNEMLSMELEHNGLKEVWLQFTGLHDKNGKEIYEGDIMQRRNEFGTVISQHEIKYKNLVDDVEGYIKNIGIGFNIHILSAQACEIIGNIYENPELLDKKKSYEKQN
jgi:uncharacterized phage protein (TIGR01671 family)